MVVTRRAPAPPTPTSRTNSAQPIPRVKGKVPLTVPEVSSPLVNSTSNDEHSVAAHGNDQSGSPSQKGKGKWKAKYKKEKEKRKKGGSSFLEFLTRILLLWFTVYTLSVCPSDDSHKSPICRGLSAYHRYILEPYVLPPVQRALAHPSVAPYVDRVTPIIQTSIDTAKPALLRVQSEWSRHIVPQWNKRVIPQWRKHVVPQLDKHVWPYTARARDQVLPYIETVQVGYDKNVGPAVRLVTHKLQTWQHQARPYIILAAHKTYDGYQTAKPYAIPVLQQLRQLLVRTIQFLGEQRRQFVDPHVQKIWERVKELSSGEKDVAVDVTRSFTSTLSKPSVTATSFKSSVVYASSSAGPVASEARVGTASSILPDIVSESETLPAIIPTTNPVATLKREASADNVAASAVGSSLTEEAVPTAASAFSSITEELASSGSSLSSLVSSVIMDDVVPTASTILQETVVPSAASFSATASASISHATDAVFTALSDASVTVEEVVSRASSVASSVTDQVTNTVSPSTVPTRLSDETGAEDDLDLDSFYAELGLHDLDDILRDDTDDSDAEFTDPIANQASEEEQAEERRRRKELTAKKREDITSRHSKWESELEERISRARKDLRKLLVASRKAAVVELKGSQTIRKEVDGLVEEAEKFLKGAEKYMGNLRRESKTDEEKRIIWERVVEKVDKKFEERLSQTEAVVNGWYMEVINKEVAEVRRLVAEVKDVSDRAQADIGLDYAWLDDVTVADWQRYHDLERRVENFTAVATTIQDGTHPSPPINPVLPALEDLQNEVQDVVVGFETRLRRIKRNGERAFGAAPDAQDTSDETVSILPIEEDSQRPSGGESPVVPPVVIGRSKEEILSALNRIAEQEGQATSAPNDEHVQAQQIVASLAQEAVDETSHSPATHEEL